MKKQLLFYCAFLLTFCLQAQFSSPSDVTYNASNGTFYIANQGAKEIVSYKNSTKTTFISGLTKPNAILFGTLPLGSGFLVADSNVIKAYTSTGTQLTTINISGAVELSDIVADAKTQAMYVSDVGRDYIYKITFGPAPFYLPSVTNFVTTGLSKPSAMFFDSAARSIMVVSNVNNTAIQKLNVDTKGLTNAMTTTIDMAYGIEKDIEGNYYVSSWGDNYVHQVNKYFTASKKMLFYNKPGKFYFMEDTDYLYFTCYGCGKLEQVKIHNFAPDNAVEGCAGDSFDVYTSSFATNYGCYAKTNRFYIQVSDKNGSFKNFTNLVTIIDTAVPYLFQGKIPAGMDAGNYKLRIVSTVPYVESFITKDFIVKAKPSAKAYTQDTAFVCIGSGIKLGDNNPSSNIKYSWNPSTGLDDDKLPNPTSTVTSAEDYTMIATDTVTGCLIEDKVVVKPISNPPTNFDDTISLCSGDSVKIGSELNSSFDYNWTPGIELNDSTSNNPTTSVVKSTWFYVAVGSGSCASNDSVYVKVNDKPELMGWKDTFWKCKEKAIVIGGDANSNLVYKWEPPIGINKDNVSNPECFVQESKVYELRVKDEITGCFKDYKTQVIVNPSPAKPIISELNDTTLISSEDGDSFAWFKNEVIIPNSNTKELKVEESADYKVKVISQFGCETVSDKYEYKKIDAIYDQLKLRGFSFYPNPVKESLEIKSSKNWTIVLKNIEGKELLKERNVGNATFNLNSFEAGVYFLSIELDKELFQLKIIKI